MGEYSKKLHIRKNGVVEDITLYTEPPKATSTHNRYINGALPIRDGDTVVYAALSRSFGTSLKIRKNGEVFYVLQAKKVILKER